jgi:hypothetical protein
MTMQYGQRRVLLCLGVLALVAACGPSLPALETDATDEAGSLPSYLTPDDPILRWQNFLTNPTIPGLVPVREPPRSRPWLPLAAGAAALVALLFLARRYGPGLRAGERPPVRASVTAVVALALLVAAVPLSLRSGRMTQEQTEEILTGLLLNVYKSFDYREEEAIYDAIARTTSGDLLTEIYLQTRRSLELANQGGARAKVRTVDVLEATPEPLDGSGFRARTTWNVTGSVGHWGHVHQRSNQYLADITVRVIDDAWRITELEVLNEERIQATPAASAVPGGL